MKRKGNCGTATARLTEPSGGVDNILKIHSLNPDSLDGHVGLYSTVMRGSKELPKGKTRDDRRLRVRHKSLCLLSYSSWSRALKIDRGRGTG